MRLHTKTKIAIHVLNIINIGMGAIILRPSIAAKLLSGKIIFIFPRASCRKDLTFWEAEAVF